MVAMLRLPVLTPGGGGVVEAGLGLLMRNSFLQKAAAAKTARVMCAALDLQRGGVHSQRVVDIKAMAWRVEEAAAASHAARSVVRQGIILASEPRHL